MPAAALAGRRWTVLPLSLLAGCLVAAAAVTLFLALGGSTTAWFVVLSAASPLVAAARWLLAAKRREDRAAKGHGPEVAEASRAPGTTKTIVAIQVVAALALIGASAYGLRALVAPTIGYDTRVTWFIRSAWFLAPHATALHDMRFLGEVTHAGYSPLVSAAVALAWKVTGTESPRLGVVVVAMVNAAAVVVAAWAMVELGCDAARRLGRHGRPGSAAGGQRLRTGLGHDPNRCLGVDRSLLPAVAGACTALVLAVIAFGVCEPSLTNGYADPLWSVSAVGATAYGLQMTNGRGRLGIAALLVMVAGETKLEGAAVMVGLIGLLVLREVLARLREGGDGRPWWPPIAVGAGGWVALGAWPMVMRLIHTGANSDSVGGPKGALGARLHAIYQAMAVHLDVVVLAAAVMVVGLATLVVVRRRTGAASDVWAWTALVGALVVLSWAYVLGSGGLGTLHQVLATSAHRLTEYPALQAWWIVAAWVVVAAAVPAFRAENHHFAEAATARHTLEPVS